MMSLPYIFLSTIVYMLFSWRGLSRYWRHLEDWTQGRHGVLWLHEVLHNMLVYLLIGAGSLKFGGLSLVFWEVKSISTLFHWGFLVLLFVG